MISHLLNLGIKAGIFLFGSLFFIIAVLIFLPIIFLLLPFMYYSNIKENKAYQNFLQLNDGKKFFCYTSKKKSRTIIETIILPQLDPDISIILLDGKKPVSDLPLTHISRMLYNINNLGFPNLMKITNGRVLDISLKKELYKELILDSSLPKFQELLKAKIKELDEMS